MYLCLYKKWYLDIIFQLLCGCWLILKLLALRRFWQCTMLHQLNKVHLHSSLYLINMFVKIFLAPTGAQWVTISVCLSGPELSRAINIQIFKLTSSWLKEHSYKSIIKALHLELCQRNLKYCVLLRLVLAHLTYLIR